MERKGSCATTRHRYGKVVAVVQQSDTTASFASWLKGIWLLIAFAVPPPDGGGGASASAACHETEIAMLGRQSVNVRDPNELHIIDFFETSQRQRDGACNMLTWQNCASFCLAIQKWFANPVLSDDMCYTITGNLLVNLQYDAPSAPDGGSGVAVGGGGGHGGGGGGGNGPLPLPPAAAAAAAGRRASRGGAARPRAAASATASATTVLPGAAKKRAPRSSTPVAGSRAAFQAAATAASIAAAKREEEQQKLAAQLIAEKVHMSVPSFVCLCVCVCVCVGPR